MVHGNIIITLEEYIKSNGDIMLDRKGTVR